MPDHHFKIVLSSKFPAIYIYWTHLENISLQKSAPKYCSNEIGKKKLFGLKLKILFLLFSLCNHFVQE